MIRNALILGSLLTLGQVVNPGGGGGVPTGPCGGDLGGTMPNCTVTSIANATGGATGLTNTVTITKPKSGGTTNLFNMLTPDASSSFVQFGLGRDGSTNDTVFFNYAHIGNNSAANYLAIDFFGVADTVEFFPAGLTKVQALQGLNTASLNVTAGTGTLATGSTNIAGAINSTVSGTLTFTLTWGSGITYSHRAVCRFEDETTTADTVRTSSANATTLTATGTVVSGDVITYSCVGY